MAKGSKLLAAPKKLIKRFRKLNKNVQLSVVLAVLLVFVGLWAILFNQSTSQEIVNRAEDTEVSQDDDVATMDATISYIEGVVEIKNPVGEWSDAELEVALVAENGIRTRGATSKAVVTYADGSETRIGPNSEVQFEQLLENKIVVQHSDGYVFSRVTPSDRIYTVVSENAEFQAVGTAFQTIVTGDEESAEVFHNTVRETKKNLSGQEGKKIIITNVQNEDSEGTVENLDLEEVKKDDFVVWNRERDQKNDLFKDQLGFLKDFDGPEITIDSPTAGSTVQVASNATSGAVSFIGRTERRAKLTVESKTQPGSQPVSVSVGDDGSFTTPELTAPVGNAVFEFVATDARGNKTTSSLRITFSRTVTTQQQGIALTVDTKSDEDALVFQWSLIGITTPDGVRVIYSTTGENAEPKSGNSVAVGSGSTYTLDTSKLKNDKDYTLQVCRYISSTDSCDIYSNAVTYSTKSDD